MAVLIAEGAAMTSPTLPQPPSIQDLHAFAWPEMLVLWGNGTVELIDLERVIEGRPGLASLREPQIMQSARPTLGHTGIEFTGGLRIDASDLAGGVARRQR
ncbi:hypothetical protein ACFSM5_15055 [Lacibacterium aquatile]|uniref:Uncharacterized protein n=1 Tax=Lacibacterium aquatile TaxID=1168082 RepID=A0ABW5DUT9_9PROT